MQYNDLQAHRIPTYSGIRRCHTSMWVDRPQYLKKQVYHMSDTYHHRVLKLHNYTVKLRKEPNKLRTNELFYWIASCDRCHAWGRWCLLSRGHLVALLAGPVSHTSIQYMNYVEIFNFSMDLSVIYLLVLVSVEFPSCVVVTPSWNIIICFWGRVEYKIVLFYFKTLYSLDMNQYQTVFR